MLGYVAPARRRPERLGAAARRLRARPRRHARRRPRRAVVRVLPRRPALALRAGQGRRRELAALPARPVSGQRDAGRPAQLVTPGCGVQARIVAHNRWHPDEVLVALNDRDPQLHDLHRLDLATRRARARRREPRLRRLARRQRPAGPRRATMDADGGVAVHARQGRRVRALPRDPSRRRRRRPASSASPATGPRCSCSRASA